MQLPILQTTNKKNSITRKGAHSYNISPFFVMRKRKLEDEGKEEETKRTLDVLNRLPNEIYQQVLDPFLSETSRRNLRLTNQEIRRNTLRNECKRSDCLTLTRENTPCALFCYENCQDIIKFIEDNAVVEFATGDIVIPLILMDTIRLKSSLVGRELVNFHGGRQQWGENFSKRRQQAICATLHTYGPLVDEVAFNIHITEDDFEGHETRNGQDSYDFLDSVEARTGVHVRLGNRVFPISPNDISGNGANGLLLTFTWKIPQFVSRRRL